MTLSLYIPGDRWLHRIPADVKLLVLLLLGVALFFAESPLLLGVATIAGLAAVSATGATFGILRRQLSGIAVIAVIVVAANAWLSTGITQQLSACGFRRWSSSHSRSR